MASIRPLCPELAAKAEKELFEVPSRVPEDLQALKDWLAKQPHIKARTNDQFLLSFLRGSKYSLERAKEKLDMFYTVRTAITELFTDRDCLKSPSAEVLKCGVFLPLPNLTAPDAPRIVLIRPGAYDANKHTIQDVMKVSSFIMDILHLEDDNLIVAGQLGILDLANVGMGHFVQMTPGFIKKMTMMSQEASPFRQKGFHYVNTPSTFETVFNIFKSFMNEKNKSRVSDYNSIYNSCYNSQSLSALRPRRQSGCSVQAHSEGDATHRVRWQGWSHPGHCRSVGEESHRLSRLFPRGGEELWNG